MKAAISLILGLVLVVGFVAAVDGSKRDAPPKPKAPDCQKVLDKPKHGKDAVAGMGSNTGAVAAKHGKSADKLAKDLISDPSMWVDPCGELFYQEDKDEIPVDPPQDASTLIFPRDQTFALHSKAGSSRVLYIDFNGELVTGTAWNANYNSGQDIAAGAFDMDGSPSTFNDDEMAIIQNVWLRVAEDYQPFDVDVTTADPGLAAIDRDSSTDTVFGSRVIVTNDGTISSVCGCAGISYVGVFDMAGSHQYYQPSWAFQRATGANAKVIGEVVAHEAGHSLGLSHEGTTSSAYYSGQGSWAPIMGTAYNRPISQWSKGEYSGANNTEDEFAVMQSHGLALRPDNVGNSMSAATALQSGVGINTRINSASDTDWFSISGSGQMNVVANVAPMSPDLDLGVWLYNSAGTLIAQSDPPAQTISGDQATGLSINQTFSLPSSGTYYLKFDGVGYGDPTSTGYSDYASTGEYTLTVTVFDPSTSPTISTTALPAALFGQQYQATLSAASGVPPYTFGVASGSAAALPDGLTLSANTGAITGSPTGAAGTYNVTFKVTDKQGNSTTKALPIAVQDAALQITSTLPLAPGSLYTPYSYQLQAAGGRGNYVWSLTSGSLPAGVLLSTSGLISGTPTITRAATYSFTVKVTSGTASVTKSLSIAFTAPVKITSATLADASVNVSYTGTFTATGGTGSYVWDILSGTLPDGTYQTTKYVKGIPTLAGQWIVQMRVTDTAGRSATAPVTINVYGPVSITTDALPSATKGVFYSLQLTGTGGKQPYKWSRSSGSLPSGLTLTSAGLISGTPTVTGTYTYTVKLADASGRRTTTRTFTLVSAASTGSAGGGGEVTPDALAITTSALPDATKGAAYSFQMAASGGTPGYTWARSSGSFPKNVTMSSTGIISGTPGATGTFTVTLKCTDAARKSVSVTLTLVVH